MDVSLAQLWLPIVLSAILVFFASALMWMALPHHRTDWPSAPQGDRLQELMKGARPGQYVYPKMMDPSERKDAEAQKRYAESSGFIIVKEPGMSMGKPMALSVLHYLMISFFVAYLASVTLSASAPYMDVFRVTGTTAVLGYTGGLFGKSIWWGNSWSATIKEALDGAVYGLLTAGVFGWLWP
ncbi:MAG: hypothetical protein ACRENP_03985 [Longimicrobiales bacterium]